MARDPQKLPPEFIHALFGHRERRPSDRIEELKAQFDALAAIPESDAAQLSPRARAWLTDLIAVQSSVLAIGAYLDELWEEAKRQ